MGSQVLSAQIWGRKPGRLMFLVVIRWQSVMCMALGPWHTYLAFRPSYVQHALGCGVTPGSQPAKEEGQESSPCPLYRQAGFLTSGPPGKSPPPLHVVHRPEKSLPALILTLPSFWRRSFSPGLVPSCGGRAGVESRPTEAQIPGQLCPDPGHLHPTPRNLAVCPVPLCAPCPRLALPGRGPPSHMDPPFP